MDCSYGSGTGSVVTFGSGESSKSVLRGFTVTGGSSTDGGGIYIDSSSPTIADCTVRGNSANDDGGGIFIHRASPTIIDSTVSGNTASDNGGGIYSLTSSSTITGCRISGNSAGNDGGVITSAHHLESDKRGKEHHPDGLRRQHPKQRPGQAQQLP